MALKDDITAEVDSIFRGDWTKRDGYVVPQPKDVGLTSNDGVTFDSVAVLYADLSASTQMVNDKKPEFAAEVYRSFLAAAARVIRAEGGEITAYDGDRVMSVFLGDEKETSAARCALKINHAVKKIVTPTLQEHWQGSTYEVKHVVGVDVSPMLVARTGVRGGNDLVWVGRAANYAAKLSALNSDGYPAFITDRVFDAMADAAKYGGDPRRLMWEERVWTAVNKLRIYRSNWTWGV
jgi:class 3 adenylate cyclase